MRLGQIEEGARVLDEVGRLDPENPAFGALRDKANVALGYAWLQAARPDEAKPSLQRVRLEGPFSNKALLGVGWSDAENADYEAALAPWLALRERSLLDSAVQESLLAVPYAFAQLGADKQAADHYVDAIEAFDREIARLTQSIQSIERGALITELPVCARLTLCPTTGAPLPSRNVTVIVARVEDSGDYPQPMRTARLKALETRVPLNPRLADRIRSADLVIYAAGTQHSSLFPSYLTERFPNEARGAGAGFCYHAGALVGSFTSYAIGHLVDTGWTLPAAMTPKAVASIGGGTRSTM